METAQRELEGVIQEITQEMEAIFRREFARIQAAFSQTFADLFGGGQGTLSLEDETDVLRCGIEIRAQPPGKTLRAISLLSGGERSLVAIALYFAILKIHPTPFCVVDEIEAALDEANGARFIRYLRAVASETQFLLITHRRETMEAADVLYGVTMERQGVSRVLKLDLHQAEALLGRRPGLKDTEQGGIPMGLFNKIKKLNIFSGLFSVDEDFFEELEESLILSDMGMETTLEAVETLRERVKERKIKEPEEVKACLREILVEMLAVGEPGLDLSASRR